MLKHNSYFGGGVQSVGFERNGRRHTLGVVDAGSFHFDTDAPERMTVVSGELHVKLPGAESFQSYPTGTSFEIAGKSAFEVRATLPAAYLCEFL
jgi:purine/pyrimidine-nucleoside phosphorylase